MKTNEDEKTQEQKLADEVMIWLPKFSAGVTLEIIGHKTMSVVLCPSDLIDAIEVGCEIRIKAIAFPDAPDGEEWQNPDNLTAEQVGIEDGFRLILESERPNLQPGFKCEGWSGAWKVYRIGSCGLKSTTYRVKASEHPVGSLKPKGEKLGGVYAKPIERPGEKVNPLKGLKVRRAQS